MRSWYLVLTWEVSCGLGAEWMGSKLNALRSGLIATEMTMQYTGPAAPPVDIRWTRGQGKVPFCAITGDMLTFIGYGGNIGYDRVYIRQELQQDDWVKIREARDALDVVDTIVWKDNYVFDAELSFMRLTTGRSAARAELMCQELTSKGKPQGKPYAISMQQGDFQWILKNQTPEAAKGYVVQARCTFIKKGQNYALCIDKA